MGYVDRLRSRDACHAIRGFVYQVDTTICSWLDLSSNQVIELERGEDLAEVTLDLSGPNAGDELLRKLEQVKRSDRSITLRSNDVQTFLCNAFDHLQESAGKDLQFEFLTTAPVAAERPPVLPNKTPTLVRWAILASWREGEDCDIASLNAIREFLANAPCPRRVRKEEWTRFQDFLRSADERALLAYIKRIKWTVGQPKSSQLRTTTRAQLLDRGIAASEAQAQTIYERLFFFIFDLLSQSGLKRLTPERLRAQIALPVLEQAKSETLASISELLRGLETRVLSVEIGLENVHETLNSLRSQFEDLSRLHGLDVSLSLAHRLQVVTPPPPLFQRAIRANTVEGLGSTLTEKFCLALEGPSGSGKTQLAGLIFERMGRPCIWVRLSGLTTDQAALCLDQVMASQLKGQEPSSIRELYAIALDELGSDTLLVLDDMPKLSGKEQVAARLTLLAKEMLACNLKLLTTSSHSLTSVIGEVLGNAYVEQHVPPFTDEEASELFAAHGCPPRLLSKARTKFLNELARGIPTMLTAMAKRMKNVGWTVSEDTFFELLLGKYGEDMDLATQEAIKASVPESASRELLYRLTLVGPTFSDKDVRVVASAEPPVEHPNERISDLMGVWVCSEHSGRFALSPLLRKFCERNLAAITVKRTRIALAENIVQRRELDLWDALSVITHFAAAGEFDKAGLILGGALNALVKAEAAGADHIVLTLWACASFPDAMSLGMRIYLRGVQAAAYGRCGKSSSFILDDLDLLIGRSTDAEAWAITAACLFAGPLRREKEVNAGRSARYLLRALEAIPKIRLPDEGKVVLGELGAVESLIWAVGGKVRSPEDMREWINTFGGMTGDQRKSALKAEIAPEGIKLVAERLLISEGGKPQARRNWESVIVALKELESLGRSLGIELMVACSVRTQVSVLAEYMDRFDDAIQLIDDAIEEFGADATLRFLLQECAGRQFSYKQKWREGWERIAEALRQETKLFPLVRLHSAIDGAVCAGNAHIEGRACKVLQHELGRAEVSQGVGLAETSRARAELALAHWLDEDRVGALTLCERVVNDTFDMIKSGECSPGMLVLLGHMLGFMGSIATTGSPPEKTPDGDPYAPPVRGMFMRVLSELDYLYRDTTPSQIGGQLAILAEGLGDDDLAERWSLRAFGLAMEGGQVSLVRAVGWIAIPHLIAKDKYAEAIEVAHECAKSLVVCKFAEETGRDPLRETLDVESILQSTSKENRQVADRVARQATLVPICLRLELLSNLNPQRLRDLIGEVTAKLKEISLEAEEPGRWVQAASMITKIQRRDYDWKELLAEGKKEIETGDHSIGLLCFLLASTHPDARPRSSVQAQAYVASVLDGTFGSGGVAFRRRLLCPFVLEFWNRSLERSRFRFGSPFVLEADLRNAENLPKENVPQVVLAAVSLSLGAPVPDQAKQWMTDR